MYRKVGIWIGAGSGDLREKRLIEKLPLEIDALSLLSEALDFDFATKGMDEAFTDAELAGMSGIQTMRDGVVRASGKLNPTVRDFLTCVEDADALLIATPEYNSSLPGVLKNAIDWASRPFPDNVLRHKPCVVIGASTGLFGAVWAQAEVRKALKASGAHVLESELPVGLADGAFTEDGALADPDLSSRLADVVSDLAREVAAPVEQSA